MTIRPTKLIIRNIGKIAESIIEINKPLLLFYGEIRQGKSTILNCVRWVCGGEFPQDIIKHNEREGSIELHIEGGMIGRSFYRAKDESTKARPVVFVRNGKPVSSPVSEIKRFLNPFLLDQDFLRNKTELERKQYFIELFAVNTSELDAELFNSQREAQQLRAKISGYGEIDLTPFEAADVALFESVMGDRKEKNQQITKLYDSECNKFNERLNYRSTKKAEQGRIQKDIADLEARLSNLRLEDDTITKHLAQNPQLPEPKAPVLLVMDDLEAKLRDAGAQNIRAEQYQKNLTQSKAKKDDEEKLLAMEKRQREIKSEKQAKLKSIGESCGIAGLEFDETGNFIYQGTTAGMISDSQIMRLSSELSALYPEGFGLDLIDRAESLGKSIFEFVDRAKAEKKTIMATIVGERPAKVPPEIGVFVVVEGTVKP